MLYHKRGEFCNSRLSMWKLFHEGTCDFPDFFFVTRHIKKNLFPANKIFSDTNIFILLHLISFRLKTFLQTSNFLWRLFKFKFKFSPTLNILYNFFNIIYFLGWENFLQQQIFNTIFLCRFFFYF